MGDVAEASGAVMKPGKNDPCPCGSGKKYKHCCEGRAVSHPAAPAPAEFNQLIALYNAGRYAELETRARTLVEHFPAAGFAWKLLGGALQMQGKEALPAFQKTAALLPQDAEAHYNLGVVLKNLGQLDEALTHYRQALKIKPDYAEAHSNLGNALKELGRLDEAVACYQQALKIMPHSAETLNSLGTAFKERGQLDEAVASYRRAIKIKPDYAEAHSNLGNALTELGQLAEALASCRRALEIKPGFAEAYINLGNALSDLGIFGDAVACYHRALELKPDFTHVYINLGNTLKYLGQFNKAAASFRSVLEIEPNFAEVHSNLGIVLKDLGRIEDALASYRRALELKPDFFDAYSNLLFTLSYSAGHTPADCLVAARQYGQMVNKKVVSRFSVWRCADRPERLRVGIVSGDLYIHPVGYFLESLLAQLDPSRVELIAYPTNRKADSLTARIKPHFAAWKPLTNLSDEAAAQLIHADGVHVLVDLAGHTGHNRLPVFAWKPAPVQASWLGYAATTGVDEMDYLLADEMGVRESQQKYFTETIWYLPDTRLCFTPPDVDLPVAMLPAFKNGYVTFGCFQRLDKVGDEVLAAWAAILTALPGSRLRWQCKQLGDPAMAKQIMQRLQQHGITPDRVTLHGAVSREAYLSAHTEVDMLLDTFPYPGGTTTCEALWMGVPTLTLAGDTLLARQGASLLSAAGLNNWIAISEADYVNKAMVLAGDLPMLATLRADLREQVRLSPVFDAPRFARNMEAALWGMWQKHQAQS